MQVRTGAVACTSYRSDCLTLIDLLSYLYLVAAEMPIIGYKVCAVVYLYKLSIAAFPTYKGYYPSIRGFYSRTVRSCNIYTCM